MNPTEHILTRFEEISSIPRGTKYEAAIRQWLIEWAAARGYVSKTDAAGNLAIQVSATKGLESRPILILQGHLDMVWQKTPESTHDFTRDPIQVLRDGDWVKANGTTLGADNGIAIAIMMALVEDEAVSHPPLELLLTVEEEVSIGGADHLDPALVQGRTLINLDSEREGTFTVGCAGGGTVFITLPVTRAAKPTEDMVFEMKLGGLQGGHSGEDINKHRANAIKLTARVLETIQRELPIELAALKGGTVRNAIPRDAEAMFTCPKEQADLCRSIFSRIANDIKNELAKTDSGIFTTLAEKSGDSVRTISRTDTEKALRLLTSLPNGVSAMSADTPGFVETSNNIGIMELMEDHLYVVSNHRSSVLSKLEEITRRVESLAWLAGAKTERTTPTPPWQPNMDSPLLKKCVSTYEAVLGEKPHVELSHGGLECGIISDRCGGMDTISTGPTIQNPHSPDERLYIPSLARVWALLKAVLAPAD